ncbi:Pimeloyl-ACP methyl ester carboxylesterase [Sphingomonas laterariae]|uniref:Pimeloyl-ACP methyl ester carboxylesterase n=1 Tax=Edaphosphingomonas laterariae TaxID=861865 RepID=A0A239FJ60_9SPHN|nr:alpha/beta hydrolase [Sphingomonas laterariae]SNS56966.1 Pimeloyl-ACP methyl ester carboxylesterase [Sphingomonas laterariae]
MNQAPRDGWITTQRLRLHHVEWGDPAAPPLILVHGGRDHARSWDAIASAFADRFRVIAPDLRGHGDSDWVSDGSYEMADLVADMAALFDGLGIARASVVGHSLGGNVALRHAGTYPDRVSRLIVIEGLGPSPKVAAEIAARPIADRMRDWIGKQHRMSAAEQRSYDSIDAATARMMAANPRLSPDLARHLTVHGSRTGDDGRVRFKFDPAVGNMSPADISQAEKHALWAAVTCPVILAYGKDSWASNPAEDGRDRHFRDASTALFDDAGHWLHHDRRDAFIAMMQDFIG